MPERTTEDYQGQASERVHNAINMILSQNDEEQTSNVQIESLISNFDMKGEEVKAKGSRPRTVKRPKTAKKKKKGLVALVDTSEMEKKAAQEQPVEMFPKARGLI
jgi:hypothetical protein